MNNNNSLSDTITIKRGPLGPNKTSFKKGIRVSPETEFKEGHIPWNKGLKGLRMSPATEFKKGHLPHNTKCDGFISIRLHKRTNTKYKYIRIIQGTWKQYHHYLWEKEHGPIPQNHILRFRNGNTLDCRIENLELISRAENALRNINRKKAAETMRMIWACKYFDSDKYIAFTLAPLDKKLQGKILKNPELIKLQRENLKLDNGRIKKFMIVKPPIKEEADVLIRKAKENEINIYQSMQEI